MPKDYNQLTSMPIPYQIGEIRKYGDRSVVIRGSRWWNCERQFQYAVQFIKDDGTLGHIDNPWDHQTLSGTEQSDNWPLLGYEDDNGVLVYDQPAAA